MAYRRARGRWMRTARPPMAGAWSVVFAAGVCCAAEYLLTPGDPVQETFAKLRPGDTLVVKPGLYDREWAIAGLMGTAERPIVIRGEAGAIIRPRVGRDGIVFWGEPSAHVVVQDMRIECAKRGGIVVHASHHITIRSCTLSNNGVWGVQTAACRHVTVEDCDASGAGREHGVYFSTTDYPAVRRCRVYGNAACGIHLNGDKLEGGDGMITGALIEKNLIYGNGRAGGAAINMDGVEQSVVRDNILFGNFAGGIVSFRENGARVGDGNRFINNTVYFAAGSGRFALSLAGGRQLVVRRNILAGGAGPGLALDDPAPADLKADFNLYFSDSSPNVIQVGERRINLPEWQRISGQDANARTGMPEGMLPPLDRGSER